jgi:hypothetical protein
MKAKDVVKDEGKGIKDKGIRDVSASKEYGERIRDS